MTAVLSSLPMMITASVLAWVPELVHFKPCHLLTLFSRFGLVIQGKNLVWPNLLHHTYFQCMEWKAKIIPMNFVLKFRTALPWLQSDRCQNQAEYLINAEINTQNMLFGMTTQCVYICMPLFIILQMVAPSDVHPQICLILLFPILGNYHFCLHWLLLRWPRDLWVFLRVRGHVAQSRPQIFMQSVLCSNKSLCP